ncbi:WD40-repeat-containing domain protein [Hyaloraphidium curvatum]|nr:WD40-repeat-containing domain protein [Hyaloraphidium curvatum]
MQPSAPALNRKSSRNAAVLSLLRDRELSLSPPRGQFANAFFPDVGRQIAEFDSRAYIGSFSHDGGLFYSATQDWQLHVFDGHTFEKKLAIRAVPGQWTITDADLESTGTWLAYSSITPIVHITRLDSQSVQMPLNFDETGMGRFGLWSLRWSNDGGQLAVGTSDYSILVMDAVTGQLINRVAAHQDDVNAVQYADTSTNVLCSASDDCLIKIWDRRALSNRPQGLLVGHTEGISYLAAKDGRHLASNGKDQVLKLWDLRRMAPADILGSAQAACNRVRQDFDYRFQAYPAIPGRIRHPMDASVRSFTGHSVLKTLIRCHFSPQHATGQRYVYSGSADGMIHIFDTLGDDVRILDVNDVLRKARGPGERDPNQDALSLFLMRYLGGRGMGEMSRRSVCVRDVSWHPHAPVLASTSWTADGGALAVHER